MGLIIILIILLLLFGGGGYYMGPGVGYYGGGGVSLILLIVILYLLFARGRRVQGHNPQGLGAGSPSCALRNLAREEGCALRPARGTGGGG